MEFTASGSVPERAWQDRLAARIDAPAVAAWMLAFSVVLYLGLANGGYDTILRGQVGVAIWWIVLLGALAGVLSARIGRRGWVAIGLLGTFAVWTALASGWSESAERTTIELGRAATYLGVLVLAITLQGRAAARHTVNGLASAIAVVCGLAVLSRLHPQWFPVNDQIATFGPGAARKLSYPLNYWNALAALAAMGVPLLISVAMSARTLAGRAVCAAALPLCTLCIYLTISRGGALAVAVATAAFLVLVPSRLHALSTLSVAAIGSAILISAASQRDALQDGLPSPAALAQGMEMLWLVALVCGGAMLLQVAIGLAERHVVRPRLLTPTRRTTVIASLAALALVASIAVAAGAPSKAGDLWQEFKAPSGEVVAGDQDNLFSRLEAVNGNSRFQYWAAARDANATDPLRGIGPGTFEFWWARNGTADGFVRDAHSLYFETLAESGIVGLALLGGFFFWLLAVACLRSMLTPGSRTWLAGAGAAVVAFMTAAAFEWVWELGALAIAVMLLAAVIVAGRDDTARAALWHAGGRLPKALLVTLSVAGLLAIAIPLAGAISMDDSRRAAMDGRIATALQDSVTAARIQPYAAMPDLQRALLLERTGALDSAARAARAATIAEPTNWRVWLVFARVEARRGHVGAALGAVRRSRALNPRSALLGR